MLENYQLSHPPFEAP